MGNLITLIISSLIITTFISIKPILNKKNLVIEKYLTPAIPLLFVGLFFIYHKFNFFNYLIYENFNHFLQVSIFNAFLFLGVANIVVKDRYIKFFNALIFLVVNLYLIISTKTLANYINIFDFSLASSLYIIIYTIVLFYCISYLSLFKYKEMFSLKTLKKPYLLIMGFFLTILFNLVITIILIPRALISEKLAIFSLATKLFYTKGFILALVFLTSLIYYIFKDKLKQYITSFQKISIALVICIYFLVNKNLYSGPFSIISVIIISAIFFFINLNYKALKHEEIPSYLLLFAFIISLLLFNLASPEAVNNLNILLLISIIAPVSLIALNKKQLSITNMLFSVLIIIGYFIVAILVNSFSVYDEKSFDILYLNQVYSYYDNYPIIGLNHRFLIKNFLGDEYKKIIIVKGKKYYLYLIYNFSFIFVFLALHLLGLIIIRSYLVLTKFNYHMIKELFLKNKVKYTNDVSIDSNVIPEIVITNLDKRYEKNSPLILDNLNLNLSGNKIIGLLGNNGAGKSTLIKTIAQNLVPTKGEIKICGNDLINNPSECKKLIRYLSDIPKINPFLSGYEYLNIIIKTNDPKRCDYHELIDKYAEILEIKKALSNHIGAYSFGMKQKIVLIASLLINPKILILDEPFTGLDPSSTKTLIKLFKEFTKRGNMVIFSSHIIEVVNELSDEIYFLYNGKIIDNDSLTQCRKNDKKLEDHIISLINLAVANEVR